MVALTWKGRCFSSLLGKGLWRPLRRRRVLTKTASSWSGKEKEIRTNTPTYTHVCAHTHTHTHTHTQESTSPRGVGSSTGTAREGRWNSETRLRPLRRTRPTKSHESLESSWQRHHWDGGEMRESSWYDGTAARRGRLPLPH